MTKQQKKEIVKRHSVSFSARSTLKRMVVLGVLSNIGFNWEKQEVSCFESHI